MGIPNASVLTRCYADFGTRPGRTSAQHSQLLGHKEGHPTGAEMSHAHGFRTLGRVQDSVTAEREKPNPRGMECAPAAAGEDQYQRRTVRPKGNERDAGVNS